MKKGNQDWSQWNAAITEYDATEKGNDHATSDASDGPDRPHSGQLG